MPRASSYLVPLLLALTAGGVGLYFLLGPGPASIQETWSEFVGEPPVPDSLKPPPGVQARVRSRCSSCHDTGEGVVRPASHFLNERAGLAQDEWAQAAEIRAHCTGCHAEPDPSRIPIQRWPEVVQKMTEIVQIYRKRSPAEAGLSANASLPTLPRNTAYDIFHYFAAFAPSREEMALPPDPEISAPIFEPSALGRRPPGDTTRPRIGHVQIVDLDQDGRLDVLVSDLRRGEVSWIHRPEEEANWQEETLVEIDYPARIEVTDLNGDGRLDLLIPDLGSPPPTDRRVGKLYEAINRGEAGFEKRLVVSNIGRIADARAADMDGDGDLDYVLGIFGYLTSGAIVYLERTGPERFSYHVLTREDGAIHVPIHDVDGDGRPDVVALISQATEQVAVFHNQGDGRFEKRVIFQAESPTFGSSGIELVDLDEDGDQDILLSNGDAYDLSTAMLLPTHGVQWLENEGNFSFERHDLLRMYGTYRAQAADFDGDGDLDVIAASLRNRWSDPDRKSLVWLENDGEESFSAHGVATAPNYIVSSDVGDLTGNGRPDVVTGHLHKPYSGQEAGEQLQRIGRVTLWRNTTPPPP